MAEQEKYHKLYQELEVNKAVEPVISDINCSICKTFDSVKNIHGNFICIKCGTVKGIDVDDELECQYAGLGACDNSAPSRTGMVTNPLLYQSNFSTKIVGNHASYGLKQMNNVWENLVHRERTLFKIFKQISDSCRQHNIPNNVMSYSHILYKKAFELQKNLKTGNKGSRADKLQGLIAACIYYSCKKHDITRSHQEIADICGINKSDVSTGSKLFFQLMHKELNLTDHITEYTDFLERYASRLQLSDNELDLVKQIAENVDKLDLLDEVKPWTFASTCIYFTSILYNFDLDKKDIANACETTMPTLNRQVQLLLNAKVDQIIV